MKKTKYILHGGFTRVNNDLNRTFFGEITRDVPDGGTVLLVYFASEQNDDHEKEKEDEAKLKEQSRGKNLKFLVAIQEDFLRQLAQADAVYIRGGSTEKLLDTLRTYHDLKSSVEGKTIAGSSAGAYAIARFGAAHRSEDVREGLGLLPLRVVCHYESADYPPNPRSLEKLKGTATELDLLLLRDYEWKVINA